MGILADLFLAERMWQRSPAWPQGPARLFRQAIRRAKAHSKWRAKKDVQAHVKAIALSAQNATVTWAERLDHRPISGFRDAPGFRRLP